MNIKELNIIINDLKIAFTFNEKARQNVLYWINAIGRIYNLNDTAKGYIMYNLQKAKININHNKEGR